MTLNPLFISEMFPPLALLPIKGSFSPSSVSIVAIEETKRGPSLSLVYIKGPPAHLSDSPRKEREGKQETRGRRKGEKEKERVHTLIRALPSSPPVSTKKKNKVRGG